MPIATNMNGGHEGRSSLLSPVSSRTAKAGLFRARSPPVDVPNTQQMMFDLHLNNRIDPFAGRYTPESSENEHTLMPPKGTRSVEGGYASSSGAVAGHTPPIGFSAQGQHPPSPPHSDPHFGIMNGRNGTTASEEDEDISAETSTMEMGGGSDEMLMTLLAGQAAIDCERLPIGGWEEIDSWKKVSRSDVNA